MILAQRKMFAVAQNEAKVRALEIERLKLTGEGPVAAPDRHAAQSAFGGIVNGYDARDAPFPIGVHGPEEVMN